MPVQCPLCLSGAASQWLQLDRDYWNCDVCALVFVFPEQRPTHDEEVDRYRLHQNSGDDPGYLKFLARLADPMIARVPVGASGLDYGCGPTPALAQLLTGSGRPTASYDPVFAPDAALLDRRYDFVTCSEVVEHAHDPLALFRALARLVNIGGHIGVMTKWYDDVDFATWSYRRDVTHVCFYSVETMRWIAEHFRWTLATPAPDIAVFKA